MVAHVADPYMALELPHEASNDEIKKTYRKLAMKFHPDRLMRINASPEQMQEASTKFASISSAYSLLADEQRKREYDHIYKFGGYDLPEKTQRPKVAPAAEAPSEQYNANSTSKPRPKGIGYAFHDPLAFILSQGKVRSTSVAGVQIPSRFHMAHNPPNDGFRVAFSNGEMKESPSGTLNCVSKTTQFVRGKKFSRVETTTIHPDGRKEVVIEGDDYIERRYSAAPKRKRTACQAGEKGLSHTTGDVPWYMSAWNGVKDSLLMCHNPCGVISV
jgi:hypothetical protein